jgi:hypothetical protein
MRNLLIALSTLVALATSAQDKKELFVSIPCRVDPDEVTFVYDADDQILPSGVVVVSIATLKKTETRGSFKDLTAKERKRLQKRAHRMHACEIIVINDYKRPPGSKLVDAEMEARMQREIQFYMVQRTRPCPECTAANN